MSVNLEKATLPSRSEPAVVFGSPVPHGDQMFSFLFFLSLVAWFKLLKISRGSFLAGGGKKSFPFRSRTGKLCCPAAEMLVFLTSKKKKRQKQIEQKTKQNGMLL